MTRRKEPLKIKWGGEGLIRADILERFSYSGYPQIVKYETKEFSAVCPYSGLPDIAYLKIEYIPASHIIELKSLKYYLLSFRSVGIYQENATHRLFDDLWSVLKPRWLSVVTIYNTRGGIDSTCIMEKGDKNHLVQSEI
jgi:7-cyano-7-deazaguanine reductase